MKKVKGSATIEMAYIMPVVFLVFIAFLYILFYLHDKNIIHGAGYETLIVGCQKLRWEEEDVEEQMEKVFQSRMEGKLIFFSRVHVEVVREKEILIVKAEAKRKRMGIRMEQKRNIVSPETSIRNLRWIHGD